jgi:hypothetical protein
VVGTDAFHEVYPESRRRTRVDTGSMKGHWKHLAMCAPMIALAAVLIATGASAAALVPVAGCVLMMGLMMAAMGMFAGRRGGHG